MIKPPIRWVGGKRQLITKLLELAPKEFACYYEPFVGGGALFFNLNPDDAVLGDMNIELINMYVAIDRHVGTLIELLDEHERNHCEMYYYKIRNLDRKYSYVNQSIPARAARFIYLNKANFNGLYRVNQKGENNVPFGHRESIKTYNRQDLINCSTYLNNKIVHNGYRPVDFVRSTLDITAKDFVYFDPPYIPLKATSFTSYTKHGFDMDDQIRLREHCLDLDKMGVKFMLSNSASTSSIQLYKMFNIHEVLARRNINSDGTKRGAVKEIIVTNY